VWSDGATTVRRDPSPSVDVGKGYDGPAGLGQAIADLTAPFGFASEVHSHFKHYRVWLEPDGFRTQAYFEVTAHDAARATEQHAQWRFHWKYPASEQALPMLVGIEALDWEETELVAPGGHLFADVTHSALGGSKDFAAHTLRSFNHWQVRLPRPLQIDRTATHGISVVDVNADGLDDFYLTDTGGLPNRLYVQRTDGTFEDEAAKAGMDWLDKTQASLFADLDNDGDPDAVLAMRPGVVVAENDGGGKFKVIWQSDVARDPISVVAADYDQDGLLDLYAVVYDSAADDADQQSGLAAPQSYHDANNGGRNALLRNLGGLEFEDVTVQTGMDTNNRRYSFAAAWEDYDQDGDPDLYVANDFGRNCLYRNDGGRFAEVSGPAGVQDVASGMSVAWADIDRDGDADLYVGNMFSSAGNRITFQESFAMQVPGAALPDLQRMARGNTLFVNNGDGTFHDASAEAGVTMGRWAYSSQFVDLDNSGWPDIVVANGHITNENSKDL
jgi:hypothetical protein